MSETGHAIVQCVHAYVCARVCSRSRARVGELDQWEAVRAIPALSKGEREESKRPRCTGTGVCHHRGVDREKLSDERDSHHRQG